MKKLEINKKSSLILFLIFVEIIFVFLSIKSYLNIDVKGVVVENEISKNTFSIYIEKDNGNYEEYKESNVFPKNYTLNIEKSYCIDMKGNIIDNILNYYDDKITISSNKTIYCYMFFKKSVGLKLIESSPANLNTSLDGNLYRYQGANDVVNNNYICFGTNNKANCINNTDAYMYRIIGINDKGQLKLIKKEALNSGIKWYSSSSENILWPKSNLFAEINGSAFLENITYVPTGWNEKIAFTSWQYGDNLVNNTTAKNLFTIENAWSEKINAKIGLMYMHDYYYAYQSGGLNCSSSGVPSTCQSSWLFMANNDSAAPSVFEWTMSRYGLYSSDNTYRAWGISSTGTSSISAINLSRSVRPVFFLSSDINLSGTGTSIDPYIIN